MCLDKLNVSNNSLISDIIVLSLLVGLKINIFLDSFKESLLDLI